MTGIADSGTLAVAVVSEMGAPAEVAVRPLPPVAADDSRPEVAELLTCFFSAAIR